MSKFDNIDIIKKRHTTWKKMFKLFNYSMISAFLIQGAIMSVLIYQLITEDYSLFNNLFCSFFVGVDGYLAYYAMTISSDINKRIKQIEKEYQQILK